MRKLAPVAVAALALAVPAAAAAMPVLGIKGDPGRFQTLTGQDSQVRHVIVGWGQGAGWGSQFSALFQQLGGTPMIGLGTRGKDGEEAITPQQIALGQGDSYVVALNAAVNAWAQPIYIRPFGEMNGYWNVYSAYTKSGAVKPGHQTAWFRKAFARVYLIVHGGAAADIDAKLKALGLPPLTGGDLPENPLPDTRVIWNPQGFGDPDIPGNTAQKYYPGDAYVDVVGDDLYDIRARRSGRRRRALQGASEEAVLVPGVGALGHRRPGVREDDGPVRPHAQAHGDARVLRRRPRLGLRPRDEAGESRRLPAIHHDAGMSLRAASRSAAVSGVIPSASASA
jgi:Beta-mannanase